MEQAIAEFSNQGFDLGIADPPYNYSSGRILKILKDILELQILIMTES